MSILSPSPRASPVGPEQIGPFEAPSGPHGEITPPRSESGKDEPEIQSSPSDFQCPPHMLTNFNTPLNRDDYKAYLPVMPSNFRGMMHSGSLVLGAGCMIPSVDAARVIATLPHHFCWLDAEHAPYDPSTLAQMIRTVNHVSQGRMGVVVRIPQSAPDLVAYCLNAGAAGITFPHVQNAEQAKALVDLCRFPPHGKRGYPPFTLFGYEKETGIPGKNTYDVWDEHVCCIAQIEDPDGVKNIEEICAVPGKLGIRPPGYFDGDEPEFQAALQKITAAAAKHGPNGMAILSFSRPGPDLDKRMRRGWRAFKVTTDALAIHQQGLDNFEKVQAVAEQTIRSHAASLKKATELQPVVEVEARPMHKVDGLKEVSKIIEVEVNPTQEVSV